MPQPPPIPLDPVPGVPYITSYTSRAVDLPADFLASPPPEPITATPIDWPSTPLPEWQGRFATVLDNVLTPDECALLLRLAEQSASSSDDPNADAAASSWRPAMVNIGAGREVLEPEYRRSDRIIWDETEVVRRLWERVRRARGADGQLFFQEDGPMGWVDVGEDGGWRFWGLNRRMRFLKYGAGRFFRPHCDSTYEENEQGRHLRTYYTVHFYLNDSVQAVGDDTGADLKGGATSFLSYDEKRKLDVDPKAGRVLIFQHTRMYHSGDDVLTGTKYTMRTEMMYELVDKKAEEKK
ncbi:hypothetical protein ACHAQA_002052 [Verticillium albo-atrum]